MSTIVIDGERKREVNAVVDNEVGASNNTVPSTTQRVGTGHEEPIIIDNMRNEHDWPEPKPIGSCLSAVPMVDEAMLPESIGRWCFDVADRMQTPVDYIAVSAITIMGSIIGRQLAIRPKALDNWEVVANVWGCLIGRPSMMKSPCLDEARRFLDKFDKESVIKYKEEYSMYNKKFTIYSARMEQVKKNLRKATTDEEREALEVILDEPEKPVCKRYFTQDSTVEKLQEILMENPRGILVLRDELVGFLRSMDKSGQESSRAFFLETSNGNGRFRVDRIGRGETAIEGVCVSVLGCATLGGFSTYVKEAMGHDKGADGLLQRFGLIAFPDTIREFTYTDRNQDDNAVQMAEEAFRRCNAIDLAQIGANSCPDKLPFLRYDSAAQVLFENWYTELIKQNRLMDEPTAIQSHLLKFSKMAPALSLIFHVADGGRGPVTEQSFIKAAAWSKYAEAHARRLYNSASQEQTKNAATTLLDHIKAGELPDGFTERLVYRREWTGLANQDAAESAINELVESGHLRRIEERNSKGGRPTNKYLIHPQYKKTGHNGANGQVNAA